MIRDAISRDLGRLAGRQEPAGAAVEEVEGDADERRRAVEHHPVPHRQRLWNICENIYNYRWIDG